MSFCANWCQILGASHPTNIGLVRLFIKQLQSTIDSISTLSTESREEGLYAKAGVLDDLFESLQTSFEDYFNADVYNFWIHRFAEVLDARKYKLVNLREVTAIFTEIKEHFTTEKENTSPYAMFTKYGNTDGNDGGERDLGQADFFADEDVDSLSRSSPLKTEGMKFMGLMASSKGVYTDPLGFWTLHSDALPILSRVATIILSISGCSADVERLFSRSGLVVSKRRSKLTSEHVNELSTLNSWLSGAEERIDSLLSVPSAQEASSKANNFRFVRLNNDLEFNFPTELEEEEDLDEDMSDGGEENDGGNEEI
jgi:hAT family C-terminal dimerisation region